MQKNKWNKHEAEIMRLAISWDMDMFKKEKNDVIKLSLGPLSLVKTQFVTFYSHLCTKKQKIPYF